MLYLMRKQSIVVLIMAQITIHIVILTFFVVLSAGQDLVLKPSQDLHTKSVGSSIVLTCEVTGASGEGTDFSIKWLNKNNEEIIDTSGRMYIEVESGNQKKLYITEIKVEDAGRYSCQATIAGVLQEKGVTLEIFQDITFENMHLQQNLTIHTNALIQCEVTGNPTPVVSWRHKGRRLSSGERYSVDASRGLTINNITKDDSGTYICRGEVEADGRYSERAINVTVFIPPSFTKRPSQSETVQGLPVSFSCQADGIPEPTYEFFKDDGGQPLRSTDSIQVNGTDGSISFSSVTKLDEGNYTCKAINDVGSEVAIGEIRVLVKPSIDQLDAVVIVEGKSADLVCLSSGDPQPTMTFRKDGRAEDYQLGLNDDGRVSVSSDGPGQLQLTIMEVTLEDAGRYTCTATSKVGTQEKTASLTVQFPPRFENVPKRVYNWVEKAQNLTCRTTGVPSPSIEWLHSGVALVSNDTYHIYDFGNESRLQVMIRESDQGWIFGSYVCRAKNEHGELDNIIEMIRATAPDVPVDVEVLKRLPTAVTLKVIPPEENGGTEITGYRVEYQEKVQPTPTSTEDVDDSNKTDSQPVGDSTASASDAAADAAAAGRILDSTDENVSIMYLKPNATYIFKVQAKNEVGFGDPFVKTVTTDAFNKPLQIVITSQNRSDLPFEYTVTWEPPSDGGKPIKQYKFIIKRVDLNDESTDEKSSEILLSERAGGALSHTLKDLSASSDYSLTVSALNDVGWSEPSQEFFFSTSPDPNAIPTTPDEEELTTGPAVDTFASETKEVEVPMENEEVEAQSSHLAGAVSAPVVVGIVIAVFIIFLLIVDVTCYFVNSCGITSILCRKFCPKKKKVPTATLR